ncbi:uncharacterized protein LOC134842578 [Symsagittifera roscoffensis]|uniref:uncharacterized protein LOC134842578 n=1 Tax=Symsagittifera roscoffensis TaxID=84072 RepID=UPI00307CB6AB
MASYLSAVSLAVVLVVCTITWPRLTLGADDDDDDDGMCDNDLQCEIIAAFTTSAKTECCDGECRETCLSVGLLILLFVLLPCLGCVLCVGLVIGGILCAIKLSNQNKQVGQVIVRGPSAAMAHTGSVHYNAPCPYPVPPYNSAQPQSAPLYMPPQPPHPQPPPAGYVNNYDQSNNCQSPAVNY